MQHIPQGHSACRRSHLNALLPTSAWIQCAARGKPSASEPSPPRSPCGAIEPDAKVKMPAAEQSKLTALPDECFGRCTTLARLQDMP
eukprot:5344940-Amphidinium_carterae.2